MLIEVIHNIKLFRKDFKYDLYIQWQYFYSNNF